MTYQHAATTACKCLIQDKGAHTGRQNTHRPTQCSIYNPTAKADRMSLKNSTRLPRQRGVEERELWQGFIKT